MAQYFILVLEWELECLEQEKKTIKFFKMTTIINMFWFYRSYNINQFFIFNECKEKKLRMS